MKSGLLNCVLVFLLLFFGNSCSDKDNVGLTIAVSILPQKYIVERITQGEADVFAVIPPGAGPGTWEPTSSILEKIANSDVFFSIGVPYEDAWLPRFQSSAPALTVISTISNIRRRDIGRYGIVEHHSCEGHASEEDQDDPHVWLSPELVSVQAQTIADYLIEAIPGKSAVFRMGLDSLLRDIEALQVEMHNLLDSHSGASFITFHPAWGYFADEFSLIQIPIEVSGSEPSPSELRELIDIADSLNINTVFVSPQFSMRSAETIAAETGAEVIAIDPLSEDWLANMSSVARSISESFK